MLEQQLQVVDEAYAVWEFLIENVEMVEVKAQVDVPEADALRHVSFRHTLLHDLLLHMNMEADVEMLADGVDHLECHRGLVEEEGHVADLLVAELLALLQRVEEARVLAVLESFTGPLDLVACQIQRAAVGEGSSASSAVDEFTLAVLGASDLYLEDEDGFIHRSYREDRVRRILGVALCAAEHGVPVEAVEHLSRLGRLDPVDLRRIPRHRIEVVLMRIVSISEDLPAAEERDDGWGDEDPNARRVTDRVLLVVHHQDRHVADRRIGVASVRLLCAEVEVLGEVRDDRIDDAAEAVVRRVGEFRRLLVAARRCASRILSVYLELRECLAEPPHHAVGVERIREVEHLVHLIDRILPDVVADAVDYWLKHAQHVCAQVGKTQRVEHVDHSAALVDVQVVRVYCQKGLLRDHLASFFFSPKRFQFQMLWEILK